MGATPLDDFIADVEPRRVHPEHEFYIPVHGFVTLTKDEVAIVNHPAFQRLGEIMQLGQSHLVYRGATHRRLEHSLGALFVAEAMLDAVAQNRERKQARDAQEAGAPLGAPLTDLERAYVRLAALLHDIGHLPAGHTLEDELHLLPKHDACGRINLILDRTSWPGGAAQPLRTVIDSRFAPYGPITPFASPSELLIQLIAKDAPAHEPSELPLRLNICRDIVGNTICADLLDYLHRDWHHLGKPKHFDSRLFQYMEIRDTKDRGAQFVISLGKRPKIRTDAVSAVLDLLESRYQLAESVLFHRTKLSAAAMLERGIQELSKATPGDEWRSQLEEELLDHSDLSMLDLLITRASEIGAESALLPLKALRSRRLYKGLFTASYDEFTPDVSKSVIQLYAKSPDAAAARLTAVRALEDDFGLAPGTVAMYCPDKGMNAKIAEVQFYLNGTVETFDRWERENDDMLSGGHLRAQQHRFRRLWRVHVFLDEQVHEQSSPALLNLLRQAIEQLVLGRVPHGGTLSDSAQALATQASFVPGSSLHNHIVLGERIGARGDDSLAESSYPTGAPRLTSFDGGQG